MVYVSSLSVAFALMTTTVLGLGIPPKPLARRQVDNGNIVYITNPQTYCMIVPRTAYTDIGTSETPGGMQTYCSPRGVFDANVQGVLPDAFWSNVEMSTTPGLYGARKVQLTGCIRPETSSQLNPADGGGQYDSSGGDGGIGNPQYSICLGYNHYVELIEPAGRRACLRCCDDPADCPVVLDTQGCQTVIPGNYFDCTS